MGNGISGASAFSAYSQASKLKKASTARKNKPKLTIQVPEGDLSVRANVVFSDHLKKKKTQSISPAIPNVKESIKVNESLSNLRLPGPCSSLKDSD